MRVDRLTFPCDDIEPLMRAFHAEHRFAGRAMPLNEEKARAYLHGYLQKGDVFGAYEGDTLVGSIALFEAPFWWTDSTALWDGWFFVHPAHRSSRAGLLLTEAAKNLADERGLPLSIGISHSDDLDRKVSFFERRGFRQAGAQMAYGAA